MIYTDFESVLVPEVNGKQNPEESKHIIYFDLNRYKPVTVQKDVFSKLILNIQKNYANYIMIIL